MKPICVFLLALVFALAGCVPAPTPTPQSAGSENFQSGQGSSKAVQVAAAPAVQAAGGGSVEIIGGDEALLQEFVQRWFNPAYPGAPAQDTKIWLGRLPENLPVEIPLPAGARVIAGIQDYYTAMDAILDVELDPEEVLDFYEQKMSEAGWVASPESSQGSGFVPQEYPGKTFCYGEDEAQLTVSVFEREEGPTDLRLNLQTPVEYSACQEQGPGMDPAGLLIPALKAPDGVEVRSGGSSSGGDEADISASLKTDLGVAELADHYNQQLEETGWQKQSSGAVEGFAWSSWAVTDERGRLWNGTLIVVETPPESDLRFAMVRVVKDSEK